jgi:hypothetical protein
MNMTTQFRAFKALAATQTTAVTNTNQNVALNWNNGTRTIRLCNIGTEVVWVNFDGVAAVGTGIPIPANQTELFIIGKDVTSYGVIAATGGANSLYSTIGEGL